MKQLEEFFRPWVPSLLLFWIAGVVICALRLGYGCYRVQTIRHSCKPISNHELADSFEKLKKRLKLGRLVNLMTSGLISTPMVVGWLQPIVVLPCSAMSGLTPDQLTAILAHELSHIRRADYLVNLLQSLIEVFLFYHPAVWWISNKIRTERENCCDDLVTNGIASRKVYAESLLQLASQPAPSNLAISANGGDLLNRIERLYAPTQFRRTSSWLAASVISVFLILLISCLSIKPAVQAMVTPTIQEEQDKEKLPDPNEFTRAIEFIVTDENGKPAQGVKLHVGVWQNKYINDPQFPSKDYVTDKNGIAKADLPEYYYIVRVWANFDGYVPMFIHWEEAEIKSGIRPPEKYNLQLTKGTTIGGTIVDESGQPIQGATVSISAEGKASTSNAAGFSDRVGTYKTEKDGRWKSERALPGNLKISISVTHPNYPDKRFDIATEKARAQSATSKLVAGVRLKGTILNSDGFAVKSGTVAVGNWKYQTVPIAIDGTFETGPLPVNQPQNVTIIATGSSPWTKEITLDRDMKPLDIRLDPPNELKVKIVDEAGNPIPNAYLQFGEWRDLRWLNSIIASKQVNADGTATWKSAPNDVVRYNISARGYMFKTDHPIVADGEEHKIVLQRQLVAGGMVRDAETGEPVLNARVIPLVVLRPKRSPDRAIERRDHSVTARDDGAFELELHRVDCGFRLLIEAEGYQTSKTDLFTCEAIPESFDIRLRKSSSTVMTIIDTQGNPIDGASAFLTSESNNAKFDYSSTPHMAKQLRSDAEGCVKFQSLPDKFMLVAFNDEGYGQVVIDPQNRDSNQSVTLQPWSGLEGTLPDFDKTRDTIFLVHPIAANRKLIDADLQFKVSKASKGKFSFDRIPPGPALVELLIRNPNRPSYNAFDRYSMPINFESGKKAQFDISKRVRAKGKFEFDDSIKNRVDLSKSDVSIRSLEPLIPIPEQFLPFDPSQFRELQRSADIERRYTITRCFSRSTAAIEKDGSFDLDVLSPGKYVVRLTAVEKVAPDGGDIVGSFFVEHESIIEVTRDSTELKPVIVNGFPEPKIGDTLPDFEFKLLDGSSKKISDYRGKKVLLDIWTTRSPITSNNNAKLNKMAQAFLEQPDSIVISLESTSTGNHKRSYAIPKGVIQGEWIRLKGNSRKLGLWRFPKYFVLDESGKILEIGT